MSSKKYTYSISGDFPGGNINQSKLIDEITSSSIVTAFDYISSAGNSLFIWFKAELSTADKTTLDGDISGPAGGLIAMHDNTAPEAENSPVEVKNTIDVVPQKPDSSVNTRIYSFSVNICDKTTWYVNSQYANNVLAGDGTGNQDFSLPHGSGNGDAIVDLVHGKVTDETLIIAPSGSYSISVMVSGIAKTERECYELSGGDYEVDYTDGSIHFFEPVYGDIRATYYYSPSGIGPVFTAAPPSGKKWTIDSAELQMSSDFELTDTIVQNVFLTHPIYGRIKATTDTEYKNAGNFLDFTYGSYPIIPAFGGAQRGCKKDTTIMRWSFLTPIELLSSYEMELRSWTKHGRSCPGERFVISIYGLEQDE